MDLNAAYRACARLTRREARNFYYAFLSLPTAQRQAVYALYAFCREADDVVDSASGQSADAVRDRLGAMRARLADAAAGSPTEGRDVALADAIERFGIDPRDLADILDGMEMDLTLTHVETTDELDRYCYHAASSVGLATLPILNEGIPPNDVMREAAVNLGLGMQYVNILRDVAEDLARGRVYLPSEALDRYSIETRALHSRTMTPSLRALFSDHATRARQLLDRGRRLVPMLPPRSRSCPWLLAEIYGRLLSRIAAAEYDVFSGRASLPKAEKVALLVSATWRRL
jgi:15-cis-phytoene synthase